ncbi:MAG: preprotein translocase subunit SecG [Beijerinckiaceae bacterium]
METVLIVVHLLIVSALAVVVLLQRSEGGGLGIGGASSGPSGFLTGRGQANVLTRTTAILGAAFFVTSLMLAVVASRSSAPKSIIDGLAPTAPAVPGAPGAPATPGSGGVLDQLNQIQRNAPAAPPAAPAPPTAN